MLNLICSSSPQAFTIIDQNRDGIISKDDLRDVLASMGERWIYGGPLNAFHLCLVLIPMSGLFRPAEREE